MIRNPLPRLIAILIIFALALWVDFSETLRIINPFDQTTLFETNVTPRLGLDLRGGLQVLMEADLPADAALEPGALEVARDILEQRTNALGVSENVLQVAGSRRIVGEFPGIEDAQSVLATLQQTGLLEFVDTGTLSFNVGDTITTDFDGKSVADGVTVFHTIMTGKDLATATVIADQVGRIQIGFTLSPEGAQTFGDHTSQNIGKFLTIVLDKRVVSSPSINDAITGGEGVIQGQFTQAEANALVVQLRYGSLPIPLKIIETRIVGPTLGEDSLQKSLVAGIIGMIIVILFMALYYRLPGLVADFSIIFYAIIAFAIFKYFHFTLTLPGIAGFLLSTGSALDANILIFERIKEELRNGKNLINALDQGWNKARASIIDSNFATLLTSGILYWFGSAFGATIVKGFSLTLALGVGISLFTAIFVTRTVLALILRKYQPTNLEFWFGL